MASGAVIEKAARIEGFAIVSEEGIVGDANRAMPSELVIEADQNFLSDDLIMPI